MLRSFLRIKQFLKHGVILLNQSKIWESCFRYDATEYSLTQFYLILWQFLWLGEIKKLIDGHNTKQKIWRALSYTWDNILTYTTYILWRGYLDLCEIYHKGATQFTCAFYRCETIVSITNWLNVKINKSIGMILSFLEIDDSCLCILQH